MGCEAASTTSVCAPTPDSRGPLAPGRPAPFGVYVHIPFCARRCDYCAFATWTDRASLMGDYARACADEAARAELPLATSVFFGGGTPSLLAADDLLAVVAAVRLAPGTEITAECNPDDVTADLLICGGSRCQGDLLPWPRWLPSSFSCWGFPAAAA